MEDNGGSVHYMQLPVWSAIKSQFGWKTERIDCKTLSAEIEVYKRTVPGVGKFHYIPGLNGLGAENVEDFTDELKKNYRRKGFGLRLELNELFDENLLKIFKESGWVQSKTHIQYRHTVLVNLKEPEVDIWGSFKARGRYEVLQAHKYGVSISDTSPTDENLEKMYDLMQLTSARKKFYIRDKKFTMAYWRSFRDAGQLKLFFADHEADTLSGAIILKSGTLAWYKDGGSTRIKSNMMGARLLQWEAMKVLKTEGVELYDLGGIPRPEGHQTSSMHGIYVFKTAYSKNTVALMPTLELPLNIRYKLWPQAEKQWLRIYNVFAHSLWY